MNAIDELIEFIQVAHAGQVDKGAKAPYWQHPVAVMRALPPFASEDLKKAALLHDTVEDTAFKREGDRLVFDADKFAALSAEMRAAKRPAEIALARSRNEADAENTPTVLVSPPLNAHILSVVEGVTNEDASLPAGLNEQEVDKLARAHYQDHIIALANDRPSDPEALRVAEDRVLLKFTDMSQNIDRTRLAAIADKSKVTRYAEKYAKPYSALLARAKEIAHKYGYELHAETVLEDDGQGNKQFYLAQSPEWRKRTVAKKYDIIGDIHGHAVELKALLEKLGYARNEAGVYTPPEPNRMAIFTGDYIDRGGENFEVIDIVRGMVDGGYAHAIMGNHELNAGLFHTLHPKDSRGGELMPLRPHGKRNIHQHQAFLNEAAKDEEQARRNIAWIKSLPVYLELDGLRFVHALWDKPAIDYLHSSGLLNDEHRLHPDRWHELAVKYTPGCDAVELLTKGVEVPLPAGVRFYDADGTPRKLARLKWWANPDDPNLKLADVILDVPPEAIPNIPAPEDIKQRMREVQKLEDSTVFFGHYWQRGEHPTVEAENAICIDQSVAKDGHLAAATVTVNAGKILNMAFDSVKSRPPAKQEGVGRGGIA